MSKRKQQQRRKSHSRSVARKPLPRPDSQRQSESLKRQITVVGEQLLQSWVTKAASVLLLLLAISLYYQNLWPTLSAFAMALDHPSLPAFYDFSGHYEPTGRQILHDPEPTFRFLYGAFGALMFAWVSLFSSDTALSIWVMLQIWLTLGLFLLSLPRRASKNLLLVLIAALVFATCYPILHNFRWGQVSVLLVLVCLAGLKSYMAGYRALAASLLAAAVAIKYYPIAMLAFFFLQKDWRFCLLFALFLLLFALLIPASIIGFPQTITFYQLSYEQLTSVGTPDMVHDPNSQFFVYSVARVFDLPQTVSWLQIIRFVLLALGMAAVFVLSLSKIALPARNEFSYAILFLITPLLVSSSWPHYFCYLPFTQLFYLKLVYEHKGSKLYQLTGATICASSVLIASMFFFNQWENHTAYNEAGMLLFANLIIFVGLLGHLGYHIYCLDATARQNIWGEAKTWIFKY